MMDQGKRTQPLPPAQKVDFIRKVNGLEPACRFNPDDTLAEAADLPFYPGATLVSLTKTFPGAGPLWYVALAHETVPLDGSVANIHYLNASAPLLLTAETFESYLRFRIFFGGGGSVEEARFEERNGAWQAKVRTQEKTGCYEIALMVSPRGELTELQKEKLADTPLRTADLRL